MQKILNDQKKITICISAPPLYQKRCHDNFRI